MIFGDKLIMHMTQRSGDFPIGVPSNMVQYFAILLAVADYLDLIPYQYIHYVINAHIYVDQIEQAKAILAKEIRPFPKLVLNKKVKNLFALRHTDFDLSEYYPNEEMSFPVTV